MRLAPVAPAAIPAGSEQVIADYDTRFESPMLQALAANKRKQRASLKPAEPLPPPMPVGTYELLDSAKALNTLDLEAAARLGAFLREEEHDDRMEQDG